MKIDNILKGLIIVLLSIVGFFCTQTYIKITNIEKDLFSMRIELEKMKSEQLDIQRVHAIAKYEIHMYHSEHVQKDPY